jgi:N-acetylneuraminic acid mutarotase
MCKYVKLLVIFPLFLGNAQGAGRWSRTGDAYWPECGFISAGLTDGRVMKYGGYQAGPDGEGYEIFDPATGTWAANPMPDTGAIHTVAVLLPNGKILAYFKNRGYYIYDPLTDNWQFETSNPSCNCRCFTLLKNGQVLLGPDISSGATYLYDHTTGSIVSTAGSASTWYGSPVEVLLPSGEVLITSSSKCEIYDPSSGSWTQKPSMNQARTKHVGVLLPPPWNDKVLVAGGHSLSSYLKTELYDINSGTWAFTGDLNWNGIRDVATMVLLPSGKVFIMGGQNSGAISTRQCEIYDPDPGTWNCADSMSYGRSHFTSAILYTGKVLAMSGIVTSGPNCTPTCEVYDLSDGVWDATKPSLSIGRAAHTVTPLPIIPTRNCSTNVLIAGGENPNALKSCELYNYSLESVCLTGELNVARTHHTAVLLASGEVLAAGGKDGGALASSELFNVAAESWTPTAGTMTDARFDHTATLLKDGRVLVTGGEDAGTYLSSCETYSGGSWTSTASAMATPRARHSAVILLNGDILVIGGQTTGGAATNVCELWDGTSWSGAGSLTTGRYLHSATLLQSGKVLVIGGTSDGSTPLQTCESYDPAGNSWSAEADLNTARYLHNTTLLYSGLVLVTGGNGGSNSCEIWDPAAEWDSTTDTHVWKVTSSLATGRGYHSSVLIPDAKPYILAVGGNNGAYLSSIEEYDVGLGYRSIWQSTITNYPSITHISPSMEIEGTLFRGVSEADGGNHCHVASSDHPIISLVRIGGGNWQGNGGGVILHMPSSSSWDESHTTVAPTIADFQGYYRLWSIANGIPSKWYEGCVGVEEKEQSTVHSPQSMVFPNPSTAGAGVHFRFGLSTMDRRPSTLTICDLTGRLVRSPQVTKSRDQGVSEITIQGLRPGIYFYRMKCQGSEFKGKFIVAE